MTTGSTTVGLNRWYGAVATHTRASKAIIDDRGCWTYQELLDRAEQIAMTLDEVATRTERLIGLRLQRTKESAAAILAIWMTGRAYVPIDSQHPTARQQYVLDDARISTILGDGAPGQSESVAATSGTLTVTKRYSVEPHPVSEDLAYVLYTSGSTGAPKGCLISHSNLSNFFDAMRCVVQHPAPRVASVFHSFTFDVSVWELWSSLLAGGTSIIISENSRRDLRAFVQVLRDQRVTQVNLTPTVFGKLLGDLDRSSLPALRYLLLAGEPIVLRDLRRWFTLGAADGASVLNLYGPTETTVFATSARISPNDVVDSTAATLIGKPLPGVSIELRTETGTSSQPGEPGEMWITGPNVASGYLEHPSLTARSFINGQYRTGDWAKMDGDSLRFIGRLDTQVKIRGVRVELGEVEAVLNAMDGVAEAACAVVRGPGGEPVLAAFIVPATGSLNERTVRGYVHTLLPNEYCPQRIVFGEQLPISSSGKTDREALRRFLSNETPRRSILASMRQDDD